MLLKNTWNNIDHIYSLKHRGWESKYERAREEYATGTNLKNTGGQAGNYAGIN
jgi:hypothetical protein